MTRTVAKSALREAIQEMNGWHQNTPLLLVLSRQKPGLEGKVRGDVAAVRSVYGHLFGLDHLGISDPEGQFYVHLCHGTQPDFPHGVRKPSQNFGKTHQRIIKDTFANGQFLKRLEAAEYELLPRFSDLVKNYLGVNEPLDLYPLVLYAYWRDLGDARTVGELWERMCEELGVASEPFDQVFQCRDQEAPIPESPVGDEPPDIRALVLPLDYAGDKLDREFWIRFESRLSTHLGRLKWVGDVTELTRQITAALMSETTVFLLGPPGTGKSTITVEAILPALSEVVGGGGNIEYHEFPITHGTTQTDLLGFQGLDGEWVPGPLTSRLLIKLDQAPASSSTEPDEQEDSLSHQSAHLIFFDEANRVDTEALLATLQPAFDRIQHRIEPSPLRLGKDTYQVPRRIWRIYSGNSPLTDLGRQEQSRPFKRRIPAVAMPDPAPNVLTRANSFKSTVVKLLTRATTSNEPDLRDPALLLLGRLDDENFSLDNLRAVLAAANSLPLVAVTIGLIESVVLRAAALDTLEHPHALDAAVTMTLRPLIAGERIPVSELARAAADSGYDRLTAMIEEELLAVVPDQVGLIDPLL